MKKKVWIWCIAAIVLIAVLFVPIPTGSYDDGGTRTYSAVAYKIVDWNRVSHDGVYEKTRVYFLADRFKSIDELWALEEAHVEHRLIATVVELNSGTAVVDDVESGQRYRFRVEKLSDIGAEVSSVVEVTYAGAVFYSDPASIDVTDWKLAKDLRHLSYTEAWLDKTTAEKYDNNIFSDIVITEIYANCFFARTVIPMPYEIKLNGALSDDWCVGDQIVVTYENTYYDSENQRVEADFLSVDTSDFELDPDMCYKPVIYLYPEVELDVSVKLTLGGELTCTYPAYADGWNVTAAPDGTLTDENGQTYNYLYWEGETNAAFDLAKGFCVKGEETAAFLEDALAKLGLTRREANEFIVYWLPLMQDNPYNRISFQTDTYTDAAKLEISPTPDTLIRVFMVWQAADTYVAMEEQDLSAPAREGFTVVEWGGTVID